MKNITTSATVAVFAGLCVAIGVFAVLRGLPSHEWFRLDTVLCPLFGGAVAGLLYGRNEQIFVRAGIAVGALNGFVYIAALSMVSTMFWSMYPNHGMFIRFVSGVMTDGVVAILAGATGGVIGSALRQVATSSNLGGSDGGEERPLIRDLAPVFLFTSIISFVVLTNVWLSIPKIQNEMWGITIGMAQDEVRRSKGAPNSTSDPGVWQYRRKSNRKNDTEDIIFLVSFQVGKVAQISVSGPYFSTEWGNVVSIGSAEEHLEDAIV
jgi:hypothetical protein